MDLTTATYLFTALWLGYLFADLILSGRWWVWNLNSVIPPFMLLVVPLVFIIANVYSANSLPVFGILVLTMVLVWPRSGINLPPWRITVPAARLPSIKVVSWNTEFWAADKDEDQMIATLRAAPADVYLLQEMWARRDLSPLTDLTKIRTAFPDYELRQGGELITLSRLPVTAFHFQAHWGFSRTDVQLGQAPGSQVSIYNVHIPVHIIPSYLKRGLYFWRDVRRRFDWRKSSFADFQSELAANPLPKVLSGDFNTSVNMPEFSWYRAHFGDAFASLHGGYPTSYRFGPLKLWRIDWVLGEKVQFVKYAQRQYPRLSDHDLLQFELTPQSSPKPS